MTSLIPTGIVAIVLLSGGEVLAQKSQAGPLATTTIRALTPTLKAAYGRLDIGLKDAQKTLPAGQWRLVKPRQKQIMPFSVEPPLRVTPADPLTVTPSEPMDCKMVKSHRDDLFPAMKVITPKADVKHHIKVVTVPTCPAR